MPRPNLSRSLPCFARSGDFVVIGDIMKSLTLLVYKGEEGALELRARDYGPAWTTGVEVGRWGTEPVLRCVE